MIKPSIAKANWIAKEAGHNADDVYDALLGNITKANDDFLDEVQYWSDMWDKELRNHTL